MNERWKVLTYRDYDFTDQNNRQVKGRTLHCFRKTTDPSWPGVEYAKFSVKFGSDAYNVSINPGAEYELAFDRFGKIAQLVSVQ